MDPESASEGDMPCDATYVVKTGRNHAKISVRSKEIVHVDEQAAYVGPTPAGASCQLVRVPSSYWNCS